MIGECSGKIPSTPCPNDTLPPVNEALSPPPPPIPLRRTPVRRKTGPPRPNAPPRPRATSPDAPGPQPRHRGGAEERRQSPAAQHVVADRDFLVHARPHALVHAFVSAADD